MTNRSLLINAYDRLYSQFGPQKWWPGDTPFEIMVGAILTQNTNWKNVEKAIANLKRDGLLSARKLLDISPARLASLIRPAGYFRVKTKRLRNFLNYFCDGHGGKIASLRSGETATLRENLLSVNGIGPETADSILLYALDKPVFVIDAYTMRILSRHDLVPEETTYDEMQELFMDNLPRKAKLFNEYHALFVKCGKDFCRNKTPLCKECPLNGWNR
jgi:endonuclease-3 related protein